MKRALVIASVASMIDQFNMSNIMILQELGYEVDVACNFIEGSTCSDEKISQLKETLNAINVQCFQIDFARKVTKISQNINAYKQIKVILKGNNYTLIHCHSPIGGLLTRLAARKYRVQGTKVIYTAHGFHFYKGAPALNWILFYPIEKMCSRWTDALITINKEDFELAQGKLHAKIVEYVPGVGIDTKRFADVDVNRAEKREMIGVPRNAFLILSVGELNKNKNHQIVIKAIKEIGDPNNHYVIAGKGDQKEKITQLAVNLGISKQLHLLGYRNDVSELYKTADLYALPSFREGLNVSIIEALSSGLQVICSNIRGNVDMVEPDNNGYLLSPFDVNSVVACIKQAKSNTINRSKCMESSLRFDSSVVNSIIKNIYESVKREK